MKSKISVKTLKIIGITLGVIILLIVGVVIYLNRNADRLIKEFVEKEWDGSELSKVYDLKFGKVSLGLISGKLILHDLTVRPKESFYNANDTLRLKYPLVYAVQVPKFTIAGISKNLSLDLSKIHLQQIEFIKPDITMIDHLTETEKSKSRMVIKEYIDKTEKKGSKIEEINLDHFSIYKGSFSYYKRILKKEIVSSESINVKIDSLKLSPGHLLKTLLTRTFTKAYISLGNITYPTSDGFYKVKIKEILNSVGDRVILINKLELLPQYDKKDFGVKFGKQTNWMKLNVSQIKLDDFDLEKLIFENEIYIKDIVIDKADFRAYRDKNIPFDFSKFPPLPQIALASIKMDLDIDKITIKNAYLFYELLTEGSAKAGNIPITNLNATIYNVSNISDVISKKGPMKWDAQGKLFDVGILKLEVFFPKNIHSSDFSFQGELAPMDMTAFNPILESTYFVKVEHGQINSLYFNAKANDDFSEGIFAMAYDSLKVSILKKMTDKENKEHGFLSSIANTVVRKYNPHKKHMDAAPDSANIFFVRDKNKAIFHYLIGSLLSGIKGTIVPGIGITKEKYEKQQVKQENKEGRINKREERKKLRQEKRNK